MKRFLEKVFGSHSDREIKRLMPIVETAEGFEEKIKQLTDDELKAKTAEFKARL